MRQGRHGLGLDPAQLRLKRRAEMGCGLKTSPSAAWRDRLAPDRAETAIGLLVYYAVSPIQGDAPEHSWRDKKRRDLNVVRKD
jgi:hypothetical protein